MTGVHWVRGNKMLAKNHTHSFYLNLATTMSKVQITPTRTSAVNPIRIHCSGVRCFQLISGLARPFPSPLVILFRAVVPDPRAYRRTNKRHDTTLAVVGYFSPRSLVQALFLESGEWKGTQRPCSTS